MPEQHSQENRTLLKVLVVGENEEVREWLREMVFKSKLPWRLRFTCPLRVSSPENQMSEQDIIVLIWEKTQPTPLDEVIKRKNISSRSSESVVCEIESVGGEHKLRRTVILAPSINRDDAVFLSEYEIKMIHALPEKQNAWDTDGPKFVQKVNKLHFDESNNIKTPEETAVRKFSEYLSVWEAKKKGPNRNSARFKIQYPMKNQVYNAISERVLQKDSKYLFFFRDNPVRRKTQTWLI